MSSYFPLFFPDVQASSEVVVTQEEIKAFHKLDRTLFSRFVFVLKREMNQSFEVFCFLYMIEQAGYARELIAYLVSSPDAFIDSLANEIVVCLSFLYNKAFSTAFFVANTNDDHNSVIPLIVQLTGGKLTLRFIHTNREAFLQGMATNMTDTCRRALADLLVMPQPDLYTKERISALDEAEKAIEEMQKLRLMTTAQQGSTSRLNVRQETTYRPSVRQETTVRQSVRPETTLRPSVRPETTYRPNGRQEATYRPNGRQEATYRPVVRQEYRPVFRQETIYRPVFRPVRIAPPPPTTPPVEEEEAKKTTAQKGKGKEVAMMLSADDRTVFLTFSKGYPISDTEIWFYFTKRFGEVIEEIVMQDVEVYEQSLFAKMVLKMSHASKMDEIVTARSRNKFTINGKHVWARKYVPKTGTSAASSSSQI